MTWEESVLWLRAQPGQSELVRASFYDDPLLQAAERYHASSEWASVAAESGLPITVSQERGERLPFAEGSFDLVLGRAVMHHARDLQTFCREATRVLAPGGLFIGAREHVVSSPAQLRAFLEAHPLHRHYLGEHPWRLRDYTGALRGSGLRLQRSSNPFSSDINLFPESRRSLKGRIARRLRLPLAGLIPDRLLALLGALNRDPGRLYTFVAVKPDA